MGLRTKEQMEILQSKALAILSTNPNIPDTKIEKTLNLSRGTLSDWRHRNTNGFCDKYKVCLRDAFNSLEKPAIDALGRLIDKDNFNAIKYVLDNRDYGAPQKVKADIDGEITINVSVGDSDARN